MLMKTIILLLILIPVIGQSQVYFDTIYYMSANEDTTNHLVDSIEITDGNIQFIIRNNTSAIFQFNYSNSTKSSLTLNINSLYSYDDQNVYYTSDLQHKVIVFKNTLNTWLYYDRDEQTKLYLRSMFFTIRK